MTNYSLILHNPYAAFNHPGFPGPFLPWEWEANCFHTNDADTQHANCTLFFLFCTISLHSLHSLTLPWGSVSEPSRSRKKNYC